MFESRYSISGSACQFINTVAGGVVSATDLELSFYQVHYEPVPCVGAYLFALELEGLKLTALVTDRDRVQMFGFDPAGMGDDYLRYLTTRMAGALGVIYIGRSNLESLSERVPQYEARAVLGDRPVTVYVDCQNSSVDPAHVSKKPGQVPQKATFYSTQTIAQTALTDEEYDDLEAGDLLFLKPV